MARPSPQRSVEEIDAWRIAIRRKKITVREIARREGVSRQRIYQLLNAPYPSGRHGKHYTSEHAIWCAREWAKRYGSLPASTDWNPYLAKRRGHHERAERFFAFRDELGCPFTQTVQELFGSWSEMIQQAKKESPGKR